MKKIIALGIFLLVVVVSLISYSQRAVVLNQVVTPDPIQQQPLQSQSIQNIVYKNEAQNFSLTFPQSWDGYDAVEHTKNDFDTVCFSFKQPQSFCIFSIIKYTNDQWAQVKSKQEKNIILKNDNAIFLCDGCCKQAGDMTGGGQFNDFQTKRCGEVPEILKTFKIIKSQIVDQTINWKTYNSQNNFLTFKYPANLEKLIASKQFNFSIRSKQEILNEYEKFKDGGCPSTCGRLVDDPSLLQKQFDILAKMNTLQNCTLSPTEKEEIKSNFILFSSGINTKFQIEGIKTNDGKCGLKIVESGGFDVVLSNIYYKVSLFANDKVINIGFPIFPHGAFTSVDDLWKNIGFDFVNSVCDSSCIEKETEYFKKFNFNNNIEKQVIQTYDQIFATLKFIN